jgi:predicted amidohydrolase
MKIAAVQLNSTIGDFKGNAARIVAMAEQVPQPDLIVFPELCLCG